jgi:Ca2+-binding EF-hand superfamily protein
MKASCSRGLTHAVPSPHTHTPRQRHTQTHTHMQLRNASPDIMPQASAWQVPALNVIDNGEQDVDLLKLARTHFRKADTDGNGTLDGNELVAVVRELAQANKTPLTQSAVQTEVRKCLDQFGNGQVVDETGFCKYVGSLGDFFNNMATWREVFDRYASKDGEMQEADTVTFIRNVLTCNGQQFTEAEVVKHAEDMWKEADKDNSGAISFGEFVQYAMSRENVFTKLRERVLIPHLSPKKRVGGNQGMDLEMGLAVVAAARKLFTQADSDGNKTLDRQELESVVRDLARANRHYLTPAQVTAEMSKCIVTFGNGSVVDEEGFIRYVESMPDMFGNLDLWKDVFSRYAEQGSNGVEIYEDGARRLVTDIVRLSGQKCGEENVQQCCLQLFGEADTDNGGSVSFPEFVKYATDASRGKMFEALCVEIRSPKKGPAAGGGAAANMPRMLLDTEDFGSDFDMDVAKESAAKRLFRKADQDGNGALDANELRQVIRDLASANGRRLTDQEVQSHARLCYQKFANPTTGLTADHFEVYVASEPNLFGWLICWRNIFDKYAGQNGQICLEKSLALVQDVFKANGQNITAAEARQQATALFHEADADMSGELSFQEFVAYAQKNPEMFGRLAQINSPRKEERVSAAMIWIADVFNRADTDRGGKLEADELKPIIRDLAAANGTFLTKNEVEEQIQLCLSFQSVPNGFKGVTLQEFLMYVDQNKQLFETLFHFRVLVRVFVRENRRARGGRKTARGGG